MIKTTTLSIGEQIKYNMLSKSDQAKILNCNDLGEARKMLEKMKESVHLSSEKYQPKLHVSGSSVQYKTKNLFTEFFEEKDVVDFVSIGEMASMVEAEVLRSELNRKISKMEREGKQPLQCMIYATKKNEKVFYNNDKIVDLWARVVANTVNSNMKYINSMNHMLVNWGMWKNQIILLIKACVIINYDEKLDEVIRDLYTDYDDDKVRYTVIKRLFHGTNSNNLRSGFIMLKNADFIGNESDRKYFNTLRKRVEAASIEEKEAIYNAFRGVQGFNGVKKKRIESLFFDEKDTGIAKEINDASEDNKEEMLKTVEEMINGTYKKCMEVSRATSNITQYKQEVQQLFIQKIRDGRPSSSEIKICGIAIVNLDENGVAIPVLEEELSRCKDEEEEMVFLYVLSGISDSYANRFIEKLLNYDSKNVQEAIGNVRFSYRPNRNQVLRHYLFENCQKIKDDEGYQSRRFQLALRNLSAFLSGRSTMALYDIRFDDLFYGYLAYERETGKFNPEICTVRNVSLILNIMENVMDKTNYKGRYMKFISDLYENFKNNRDVMRRIDELVKNLTGQGIPEKIQSDTEE